ncbi:hypothetical protein DB30_00188 [Enhygromyxa salina]|uniref:Tetratricopeptide repeat protein n=1 Tax=Enhygromyxa salina TaxID=215803 RepID=A0A0C2A512_9BACT|nr:hypothetical protein DB30_00188 [Enhygromyxa salina]
MPQSRVRAAIRTPGSPSSIGGESWLLELDDGLAMMCRSSIFDPLEWLALAEDGAPAIELSSNGFSSTLAVRCANGKTFELRPGSSDVAGVTALLERAPKLASAPGSSAEPAPASSPAPADPPSPTQLSPASARSQLDALPGAVNQAAARSQLDASPSAAEPPESRARLNQALAQGNFRTALEIARQTSNGSEPDADLIAVLELAAAGDFTAAYVWTRGVKRPPAPQHGPLFAALAASLERAHEPALAWSAWEEVDDQHSSEARGRIERALGHNGPTIARAVAEQARAWFTEHVQAAPENIEAMRGLAHAHTDLDELSEAQKWVNAAIAKDPQHFDTRMHATHILSLIEVETGDSRALLAALGQIADEFPTRSEPLLDLAGHVEFDDPKLAIRCLERALEREFDAYAVTSLADLYAAAGRHVDAVAVLEKALRNPKLDNDDREQMQDQLERSRAQLGALAPTPGAELNATAQSGSRGFTIIVLLMLAALAYLLLQ